MGSRKAKQKRILIEQADGSKILKTGIHTRVIPAPQTDCTLQPTNTEIAYIKQLSIARKRYPKDPHAAINAALKALAPRQRIEIQQAAGQAFANAKRWADELLQGHVQRFESAREQCRNVLRRHGIEFSGPMPDFTWANGTRSLQPDPNDLVVDEQVRDACAVLLDLHCLEATLQTERAFLAGIAFHRMLIRPFESCVFDAQQRLQAVKRGRQENGLEYPPETKGGALSRVDALVAAGSKVDSAIEKVANDLRISKRTIYLWRKARKPATH